LSSLAFNRSPPPREIRRALNLEVSPRTVDRRLQEAGLFGRVAQKKRDYSEGGQKAPFVKGNVWACFSAAGQFTAFRFHPLIMGKEKKDRKHASASRASTRFSYIFSDTLDTNLTKQILSENLLESAEELFPAGQWWLLHDNDKKFKSLLVQQWLFNNGVDVLDFPPYSPDLNPIENLWQTLARAVEDHQCNTVPSLQDAVAEELEKVDKHHLGNLIRSMPERCAAVIAAKGWHTKY
jgi:hypothetical protein